MTTTNTYWLRATNDSLNLPCSGDAELYAALGTRVGPIEIDGVSQPDLRTIEIEFLVDASHDYEARALVVGWLDQYLRRAEWLGEMGVYDPESEDADWHEPEDVFGLEGPELREAG